MASALSSAVPVSLRQAARGAQSLVREVRNDLEDSIDKGRRLARGGRKAVSRAVTRVDWFSDDNTALVAAAVLAVGSRSVSSSGREGSRTLGSPRVGAVRRRGRGPRGCRGARIRAAGVRLRPRAGLRRDDGEVAPRALRGREPRREERRLDAVAPMLRERRRAAELRDPVGDPEASPSRGDAGPLCQEPRHPVGLHEIADDPSKHVRLERLARRDSLSIRREEAGDGDVEPRLDLVQFRGADVDPGGDAEGRRPGAEGRGRPRPLEYVASPGEEGADRRVPRGSKAPRAPGTRGVRMLPRPRRAPSREERPRTRARRPCSGASPAPRRPRGLRRRGARGRRPARRPGGRRGRFRRRGDGPRPARSGRPGRCRRRAWPSLRPDPRQPEDRPVGRGPSRRSISAKTAQVLSPSGSRSVWVTAHWRVPVGRRIVHSWRRDSGPETSSPCSSKKGARSASNRSGLQGVLAGGAPGADSTGCRPARRLLPVLPRERPHEQVHLGPDARREDARVREQLLEPGGLVPGFRGATFASSSSSGRRRLSHSSRRLASVSPTSARKYPSDVPDRVGLRRLRDGLLERLVELRQVAEEQPLARARGRSSCT